MVITHFPEKVEKWPVDVQALPVPGTERPGYTPIWRNATRPDLTTQETTYDVFSVGRQKSPNLPCLGHRPWDSNTGDFAKHFEWLTYAQVEELRTAVGSGLTKLLQEGKLGEGVGHTHWMTAIWLQNRPEFQIIDQASVAYSRQVVSLYDSYDDASAHYVLNHSESRVCFTTSSHLASLLNGAAELPKLKTIVLVDSRSFSPRRPGELEGSQVAEQWAASKGITLVSWNDVIELGRKNLVGHTPPTDNKETAALCYTSGTTGHPKAAIITHAQLAYSGGLFLNYFDEYPPEMMLSYLPLAHIYERILEAAMLRMGGSIGFFSGDVTRLVEDAGILKPTFFPGVPRVFNRIAGLISAQADGPGLKGKLLRTAINAKLANHDKDATLTHAFYDRLVFRKVRDVLGGRVKLMLTGSAPIRPDVIKLLRVCFSCEVREGYGQTENSGICVLMNPGDKVVGNCGPPLSGIEIKLRDCPELGYTAQDKPFPRGELLSRGQTVFPGYLKDEAKTKETIDEEGWLHSGDVASIDEAGRVSIIDRVKNLVKTSQGEYIAIENVEQKFAAHKLLAQFWLYADSRESHTVAIAVPEPDPFAPWVSAIVGRQITPTDLEGLEKACQEPKVAKSFLDELAKIGRAHKLRGFEIPKALKLRMDPFSIENGLLTPTFKVKRQDAAKLLKKDLDDLYAQSNGASAKL